MSFRRIACAWLASLVTLPVTTVCAASLREEAVTYRVQGYEAQRRGEKTSALSLYQKATQLDPSYPTPHNDAGVLLEEAGRLEEAQRAYQQALSLNPNYLEAHANLAMLYERLDQKARAISHWMRRYQLGEPSDPWTARAKERLVALGVLSPSAGGMGASSRSIAEDELQSHAQSLQEFHTVTEQHEDWP